MGSPRRTRPRRLRTVLPARLPQPPRRAPGSRRSTASKPSSTTGARIADVGCGHGASTLLLAETYPASTVVGFDAHDGSIDAARKRAADAGLADRVRFEVASATTFTGTYDLVCFFDCLHDMGDPAGACAHVREHLAPDGTLMLIEPFANDDLADNLNPVGAAYYGFSTLLCTPSSLSQEVGTALGAQAGEARLRDIVTSAGFKTLRRVAETPFNIVLEAKAVMDHEVRADHRIHDAVGSTTSTPTSTPGWPSPKVTASRTGRCSARTETPRRVPAHGGVLVLRAGHGELEPSRDRRVRHFLAEISDGPLKFRNLDVLREEDL